MYIDLVSALSNGLSYSEMVNAAGATVAASATTVQNAMEDFREQVSAGNHSADE